MFICCAAASSLVFLFLLDNFRRESEEKKSFSVSLLLVTLRNLKDVNQMLFVPLTIWSGIEQGFILADYTKVRCQSDAVNLSVINFSNHLVYDQIRIHIS